MNPTKKRSLSLVLGLFAALATFAPRAEAAYKGVAGQVANAAKVNATWCYNWGSGKPSNLPAGVNFYPMWWSYYGATQAQDTAGVQSIKNAGMNVLLMYNEPDHTDQANLTVAYALQGYRHASVAVKAITGVYLISPACADDNSSWMQSFMATVKSEGLACHAVALHCYLSSASSFLSYVDGIHSRYGYNVYVTEFAPTDWKSPTAITVANCQSFMATAVPGLKSRSYVLDYSWYCGTLPGTGVLGTAALFDSSGNLTTLGTQYKTY
jgi:Glycosyl hydrolase catalytic core